MTLKEQRKLAILTALQTIPWMDTPQLSRFCNGNSPLKRASELLKELEKEKWVEGHSRSLGQTKVWRLGIRGRKEMQPRLVKPFGAREMEHILGLGDIYLDLKTLGCTQFVMELREEMGKETFCPDAFFVLRGIAFFLEYQPSPLTAERWREKWKRYEKYYTAYLPSFSLRPPGKLLRPRIVVLSTQMKETVHQTALPFYPLKDIKELPALI